MKYLGLSVLAAAACVSIAHDASAQLSPISTVEHALGASPVHSVAGHGGLTAGITVDSDVAVLTWPSPSCCDQLTHLSSNDPNARQLPRLGVPEGMGIALGLVVTTSSGTTVTWFHDASDWTPTPGYADDTSLEPHTVLTDAARGLTVTVDDAVLPDSDVLQRRVTVTRAAGSPVTAVALLAHTNLGLTQNVIPRLPVGDVLADSRNDFGAVWDATANAAIHFRPHDRAPISDLIPLVMPAPLPADHFGPLDDLMRTNGDLTTQAAQLAQSLDTTFVDGVYAAVALDPPADQFQIGREGDSFCTALGHMVDNVLALGTSGIPLPIDPSLAGGFRCPAAILPEQVASARAWTRTIASAWDDAQDGTLSGNPVAAYLNDSAQRTPLAFDAGGNASARLLIAFGATATTARTALTSAGALAAGEFITRDHDAWSARAAAIAVPDTLPATIAAEDRDRIVRAARRAMLHVYAGTDRQTGAIVASIARQAPYGVDWPRDGAFFDYALDVAGDATAVTHRLSWALPLARTMPLTPGVLNPFVDPAPPIDPRNGFREYPEAAWEMNYYPDGTMGGYYRFEIDNTALMVWSACVHVGYLMGADRSMFAAQMWPQIQRSAQLLADWRDPTNGLDALAAEDDNATFSSSLHGGTTVFAALEAAARVARMMGDDMTAARWEHRAGELRDALVAHFYDRTQQRFINVVEGAATANPGSASLGPTAWLVWPSRLLPYDDPRIAAQVRYDLGKVLDALRGTPDTQGGAYLTKNTLAAAVFLANGGDPTLEPLLEEAVTRIARDVMTPDTQVMGEVFVTIRNADGSVARRENRVSLPHLWEATLFYLTTMAMAHPDRFDLDLKTLPANMTPAPGTVPFVPAVDAGTSDAGTRTDASHDGSSLDAASTGNHPSGSACACRTAGTARMSPLALLALLAMVSSVASMHRRARRRRR